MTSKIRIKLGAIEVEYEGSEQFLKEELPQLLTAVSELHAKSAALNDTAVGTPANPAQTVVAGALQGTTGTIASKLAVKQGPDLILAAAARMTFVLAKPTFTRQEIIDEIKTASAYYKRTYLNNLSQYLNNLMKDGKLLEPSTETFFLSATAQADLKARLA
jgi:hypothetical protein